MIKRILWVVTIVLLAGSVSAASDAYKKFTQDYGTLDQDLLNNVGETGLVKNFVYTKDVATFTFDEGQIYFLRYIDGRPTTAIFVGTGSVAIDIPSHLERQSLRHATGSDTTVREQFDVLFIRCGDNFDNKVREQTILERKNLGWKDFNVAKKAQGELFFRPVIEHTWDNNFQLLRSAYERNDDGFFFADFNRYTFMFDPYRPEEVTVGYEKEGGDRVITEAAVFQRQERGVYADSVMSNIFYPTTLLSREGHLQLTGAEGDDVAAAQMDMLVVLNSDSARYATVFLHYNLTLDSVTLDGQPIEFHRRKDFNVIGLLLPRYYHAGDTLSLRLWYHGRDVYTMLPSVENPQGTTINLTVTAPGGFHYAAPGMSQPEKFDGKQQFTIQPFQPYDDYFIRSYSTSYTEIPGQTEAGLGVTFLKSPSLDKNKFACFVPDAIYQQAVIGALDYSISRLGNPPGTFGLVVYPEGLQSMPGVMELPQVQCLVDRTGGIQLSAGRQAARQWFGSAMRLASERELWLQQALPEYIGLMYTQSAIEPGTVFYNELLYRQQKLHTYVDRKWDQPLASGDRVADTVQAYKGAFVLHMLRQMMIDLDKMSEMPFLRFLGELVALTNTRTFTNTDIQHVAEKYYGQPLDWFFNQWVYGIGLPEFDVKYSINPQGDQWVIDVAVKTDKVDADYMMPVTLRVAYEGAPDSFARQMITGNQTTFQLGPFDKKPRELTFNEFVSVLSRDKTGKQGS